LTLRHHRSLLFSPERFQNSVSSIDREILFTSAAEGRCYSIVGRGNNITCLPLNHRSGPRKCHGDEIEKAIYSYPDAQCGANYELGSRSIHSQSRKRMDRNHVVASYHVLRTNPSELVERSDTVSPAKPIIHCAIYSVRCCNPFASDKRPQEALKCHCGNEHRQSSHRWPERRGAGFWGERGLVVISYLPPKRPHSTPPNFLIRATETFSLHLISKSPAR
jgi:hypothetical protein